MKCPANWCSSAERHDHVFHSHDALVLSHYRCSPLLKGSVSNAVRLTQRLLRSPSARLSMPWSTYDSDTLTHACTSMTAARSCSPLLVFILHPKQAGESVLSRMAEYPRRLPSPPQISQYDLFLSLHLCSQRSASDVSACSKQMNAVRSQHTAKELN